MSQRSTSPRAPVTKRVGAFKVERTRTGKLSSRARLPVYPLYNIAQAVLSCCDNLDFMHPLSTGSMKLIVTSPPYNIGKAYERRAPLETYVANQERVIAECVRLLHPNGSLCWQVGNHVNYGEICPLDVVLYPVFKAHGLKLRNRIVWHFEHGLHCKKRLSGRYETILWFTKGDDYTFNLDPIRVAPKYPDKKYYKGPKAGQLSCNPLGKNPGDVDFPEREEQPRREDDTSLPVSRRIGREACALDDQSRRSPTRSLRRRGFSSHRSNQAQSPRLRMRHRPRLYRDR